jgi:hypothetical protein
VNILLADPMLNRVVALNGWLSGPARTPLAMKATGWPWCTAEITPENPSRSALAARQKASPSVAAARGVGAAAQAAVLIASSNLACAARVRRVEPFLVAVISFSAEIETRARC